MKLEDRENGFRLRPPRRRPKVSDEPRAWSSAFKRIMHFVRMSSRRSNTIEPTLEQALQENPPPSLQQMTKRLGFSSVSVLKAHAPGLCQRLKTHRMAYRERCRVELGNKLESVLTENPPPSLRSVYSRLNVTESIVNISFPELRRAIGLRHLQHQKQQSQSRRQDVQTEIREIVQMLQAQGICPSVPRVISLLKTGSLREWNVVNNAVRDARKELIH